jgi:hypothetical protein
MNGTGKSYRFENGTIVPDVNGSMVGAEWTNEHGNVFACVLADAPHFNFKGRYAELVYELYIKPVGETAYVLKDTYIEPLTDSEYFHSNPMDTRFGTKCAEPFEQDGVTVKNGVSTEVQLFVDNSIKNIHGIPFSWKAFIYQYIKNKLNINVQ